VTSSAVVGPRNTKRFSPPSSASDDISAVNSDPACLIVTSMAFGGGARTLLFCRFAFHVPLQIRIHGLGELLWSTRCLAVDCRQTLNV
jgi:hypothetical protein